MKPENPDAVRGSSALRAPASREKKLALSLEGDTQAVVLRCRGRITFGPEAHDLTRVVADVLPTAGRMVVDLAGVDCVDSAGLGELVLLHMWAEAAGFSLKFAGPRQPVQELFELTNLASVLDSYPTVADAVAAFTQEQLCSA